MFKYRKIREIKMVNLENIKELSGLIGLGVSVVSFIGIGVCYNISRYRKQKQKVVGLFETSVYLRERLVNGEREGYKQD